MAADNEEAKRMREYEVFNLLMWLHKVDPQCPLVEERLAQIREANPEFLPRKHPDLSHWYEGGWVEPKSPLSVNQILKMAPEEFAEYLLGYKEPDEQDWPRYNYLRGLLETAATAITQDFDWSLCLAKVLYSKDRSRADIWDAVFKGWSQAGLDESQWTQILLFLNKANELHKLTRETSRFLKDSISTEKGKIPASLVKSAVKVAKQVSKRCIDDESDPSPSYSWLTKAINHSGGVIAQFLLLAIYIERSASNKKWPSIPIYLKTFLNEIVGGDSFACQLGRVVLASQLHFLFSIDSDWTREKIFPLFDWSHNQITAEQAWHGFLFQGRPTPELTQEMMSLYEDTFLHIHALGELRDRLPEVLSIIAIYHSSNPLKEGWIRKFLRSVDSEDRVNLAMYLGYRIQELKPDQVQNVWDDWLGQYFKERLTEAPRMDDDEWSHMIQWCVSLTPVFPEVVDLISKRPAEIREHSRIYRDLRKSEFARRYPQAVTSLLAHLLKARNPQFLVCDEVEAIFRELVSQDVAIDLLRQILDNMSRIGCRNALELERLLKN